MVGGPTPQAVNEGGIPAAFEWALPSAHLSDALAEQSSRLRLGAVPVEDRLEHLQHVAFALAHGHTSPVLYPDHDVPPSA